MVFMLSVARHRTKEHLGMGFGLIPVFPVLPVVGSSHQIEIRLIPFFINFWLKLSRFKQWGATASMRKHEEKQKP
jgi:hypothetical protein